VGRVAQQARGLNAVAGGVERRRATATSAFGVSKRENHDASGFYERFTPPVLSDDAVVQRPGVVDEIYVGDARRMDRVQPASVALVVTSPPYFAGKAYEAELGEGHIPATYIDYLRMLEDVFAECVAKLEPGGRLAINVANLGRKPYRSLSSDVTAILQDRLGLLLRGEVIWQKARGAVGSCAWGSFKSPANPVLRDLSERVIIASKGRFDRAVDRPSRAAQGLPHEATTTADEFMDATTDLWELAPESATRVGHPAPFPVELPQRLIELFTYRGDVVLDPFMGSGTTAVAAVRTDRHFLGYDMDPGYVEAARARVATERERPRRTEPVIDKAGEAAMALVESAGFSVERPKKKALDGLFAAADAGGRTWQFLVVGASTLTSRGLRRSDALWRTLGLAAHHSGFGAKPLIVLTTELPVRRSAGDAALRDARGNAFTDVLEIDAPSSVKRLRAYGKAKRTTPIGELLPGT
jgi:site-specific DNA-methyltransferase (adenine-specific)